MLDRLSNWWSSIPTARLRRVLIAVYLLTAAADAAGKALAADPRVNAAAQRVVSGRSADKLRKASRPSGNFEIFRTASRHLFSGDDLYAEYPAAHTDRFKYSPTFALLFAPLAWLAWPLALFLWSALNAMLLFTAVERVLPTRQALLALALLHLEVLRAMQNAQSNALVAALIVLAFVTMERGHHWRTAAAVGLGAIVKIFPLAALTFALPHRRALRTGFSAASFGVLLVALPLLVTSPTTLLAQYRSWHAVESVDALQRWFSIMALADLWVATAWPNWIVQIAGTLALLVPLAIRRDRWDEPRFRLLYLCSLLLFVALFNHQAERASYLIAFTGAAIWFAAEPRAAWRTTLFGIAMVTIPIMSTLVPGAWLRTPTVMTYRLALPCCLIWLAIQRALLRRAEPGAARLAPRSDELRVELDLHVALERG
ncbi:MAG: glycosyltransferase family 87 protein [bacterium]